MFKDIITPLLVMIGGATLFVALIIVGVDYMRSKLVERHKTFQALAAARDCELKAQGFGKITKDGHQYNRYEEYDCDGARLVWNEQGDEKGSDGPDIGMVITSGGQVGTVITP